MAKTLVVFNSKGQPIFTQTNATENYNLLVEDVSEDKEIIGIDTSTSKCILADRQATTEEKEALKKELEKTKQELLQTQVELVDATYNNLLK